MNEALYPLGSTDSSTANEGSVQTGFNQPIGSLKGFLREQEVLYLNRALAQVSGDKEKASEILDISLATLYRKLAEDDAH